MSMQNGDFERRAQSVVQVIISLLVAWVGISVVDMGKSIARLEERGVTTNAALSDMRAASLAATQAATAAALAASNAAIAIAAATEHAGKSK
jgi:hypothetical protein